MKFVKIKLIVIVSLLLIISMVGCGKSGVGDSNSSTGSSNTSSPANNAYGAPEQPDRKAEIYGKVKSIQGNLVAIAEMEQVNSGQDLTEEERAKRREERQSMSPEERQELLRSEQKFTGKSITVTIPVGIPIKVKKEQTPDSPFVDVNISDIKAGNIVTIWTENQQVDNATAEFVKVTTK